MTFIASLEFQGWVRETFLWLILGDPKSAFACFWEVTNERQIGHCSGGDGASMIGNQLETNTSTDPQKNVLMRMVDWVENGNAPDTITGVKYVDVSSDFCLIP